MDSQALDGSVQGDEGKAANDERQSEFDNRSENSNGTCREPDSTRSCSVGRIDPLEGFGMRLRDVRGPRSMFFSHPPKVGCPKGKAYLPQPCQEIGNTVNRERHQEIEHDRSEDPKDADWSASAATAASSSFSSCRLADGRFAPQHFSFFTALKSRTPFDRFQSSGPTKPCCRSIRADDVSACIVLM
jgi:hypothetical protein